MSQSKDSTTDNIGTDVKSTVSDLKGRARDAVDQAKGAAGEAKEYLTDKMHNASDQLHSGVDRVKNMDRSDYEEVWTEVKGKVTSNPGPAILVAAGVGVVIGLMMGGGGRNR